MDNFRVEKITVGNLVEFARTALTDKAAFPFLPITPDRAIAQANNPAATDDDIGLIVVFNNDVLIAYRGFMPCRVIIDEKIHKIYTPTTFYIFPEYRRKLIFEGHTVAAYIHTEFFKLGYDGFLTGSNLRSQRFYRSDKRFTAIPSLSYMRIRTGWVSPVTSLLKKLSQRIPLKHRQSFLLRLCTFCSKGIDRIIHMILKPLLTPAAGDDYSDIECIKVDRISKPTVGVNELSSKGEISSHRDESTINWMIKYPWVLNDHCYITSYFFAKPRERFEFLAYQIFHKKSRINIGFAVFSISTAAGYTTLKILDYETYESNSQSHVLKLALDISMKEGVNVIEGSIDFWNYVEGRFLLRWIIGRYERSYFAWGKKGGVFEKHLFKFRLKYSDCDTPYT